MVSSVKAGGLGYTLKCHIEYIVRTYGPDCLHPYLRPGSNRRKFYKLFRKSNVQEL